MDRSRWEDSKTPLIAFLRPLQAKILRIGWMIWKEGVLYWTVNRKVVGNDLPPTSSCYDEFKEQLTDALWEEGAIAKKEEEGAEYYLPRIVLICVSDLHTSRSIQASLHQHYMTTLTRASSGHLRCCSDADTSNKYLSREKDASILTLLTLMGH